VLATETMTVWGMLSGRGLRAIRVRAHIGQSTASSKPMTCGPIDSIMAKNSMKLGEGGVPVQDFALAFVWI
jgi:hypothetical protein